MIRRSKADIVARQRVAERRRQNVRAQAAQNARTNAYLKDRRRELAQLISQALRVLEARDFPGMVTLTVREYSWLLGNRKAVRGAWRLGSYESPFLDGTQQVVVYLLGTGMLALGTGSLASDNDKFTVADFPAGGIDTAILGIQSLISRYS